MAHGIRIWTLTGPADAATLAAAEGLDGAAGRFPLPCLAAQVPPALAGKPPAPGAGVTLLAGRRSRIACGSRDALARLAEVWPSAREPLLAALERSAPGKARLVFADGTVWEEGGPTRVMGILNVTPDSFSDGGRFLGAEAALRRAGELIEEGADIVDVGGESTRPGAPPVGAEEEIRRVAPVLEAIRAAFPAAKLSIDTRRADTARRALDAGAELINDVSALADPEMAPLAAERGCPIVLMHMRGTPETMQRDTRYDDLVGEVHDHLAERTRIARAAGVAGDRIAVDPGLGFGKSAAGNETLLAQLSVLRGLGHPILVGASRKSFIGLRTSEPEPARRLAGSLAAAVAAVLAGAAIVRVHDVGETRRALAVADRLRSWIPAVARVS